MFNIPDKKKNKKKIDSISLFLIFTFLGGCSFLLYLLLYFLFLFILSFLFFSCFFSFSSFFFFIFHFTILSFSFFYFILQLFPYIPTSLSSSFLKPYSIFLSHDSISIITIINFRPSHYFFFNDHPIMRT